MITKSFLSGRGKGSGGPTEPWPRSTAFERQAEPQDCAEDQLRTKGCPAMKDRFCYKGELQGDYEQVKCPS